MWLWLPTPKRQRAPESDQASDPYRAATLIEGSLTEMEGALPDPLASSPSRTVIQADARIWLAAHSAPQGACVVTSLPDVSELPDLGLEGWREWFMASVAELITFAPAGSAAVFFQSDVRHRGVWVDKAHLVLEGAARVGGRQLWHRIACRRPAGTMSQGRATYSHMLGFQSAEGPLHVDRFPWEDVLPEAGEQPFSKAMGVTACRRICQYLQREFGASTIIDPFCGYGTVLAAANELGMDAIGVELSSKRCKKARQLQLRADAG
jgi:hypothetical protein